MTLVLQMLREVCEHLGLHETTRSQKFMELARRTDVTTLAAHVERALVRAVAGGWMQARVW